MVVFKNLMCLGFFFFDLSESSQPSIKDDVHGYGGKWRYYDGRGLAPNNWHTAYPKCNGSRQSPVAIETGKVVYDTSLGQLYVKNYDLKRELTLTNNGHSLSCTPNKDNLTATITWKGAKYLFHSFHFHWGNTPQNGSEHLIDGKTFPLELHIIHYKEDYANMTRSINHGDGLLVLSQLFNVNYVGDHNYRLEEVIQYIPRELYKDEEAKVNLSLESLLSATSLVDYYHYSGSLTTPPCNEAVQWIVSKQEQTISEAQLEQFYKIYSNQRDKTDLPLVNNYRPVQSKHGRKVYASFQSAGVPLTPLFCATLFSVNIWLVFKILV